jgi:hypothetical protein
LLDVLGQTIGRNPQRKADALDAGEIRFYIESLREDPPLLAGNLSRGVEKSRSSKKDLFVGLQPRINPAPDILTGEYEFPLRLNIHVRFHIKGHEDGEDN